MLLITGFEIGEIFPFSRSWIIETHYSFSESKSIDESNCTHYIRRVQGNIRKSYLYKTMF